MRTPSQETHRRSLLLETIPGIDKYEFVRDYTAGASGADVFAIDCRRNQITLEGPDGLHVVKLGDEALASREIDFCERIPTSLAPFFALAKLKSNPIDGEVAVLYDLAFGHVISTRTLGATLRYLRRNPGATYGEIANRVGALARAMVDSATVARTFEGLGSRVHPADATPPSLLRWLLEFDSDGVRKNRIDRLQTHLPLWLQWDEGWEESSVIAIDDEEPLPNPCYYALRREWPTTTKYNVATLQSAMHGDLHTDNIICPPARLPERLECLKVVDFGRSQACGLPLFDLAFLEFDVIRQLLPVNDSQSRVEWLNLMRFAMSDLCPDSVLPPPDAWNLIHPIRKAIARVKRSQEDVDTFDVGWWLATAAAGLHFALRAKKGHSSFDRFAGLLYAAFGLRNLLNRDADSAWDRVKRGMRREPIVVWWTSQENHVVIKPLIHLELEERDKLTERLCKCESLQTFDTLRAVMADLPRLVISKLPPAIINLLSESSGGVDPEIIQHIVSACANFPDGLHRLAATIKRHEITNDGNESSQAARVAAYISDLIRRHYGKLDRKVNMELLTELAEILSSSGITESELCDCYNSAMPSDLPPLYESLYAYCYNAESLSLALSRLAYYPPEYQTSAFPSFSDVLLYLINKAKQMRPRSRRQLERWEARATGNMVLSWQAPSTANVGTFKNADRGSVAQQVIAASLIVRCEPESQDGNEPLLVHAWLRIDRGHGRPHEEQLDGPPSAIKFDEISEKYLHVWLDCLAAKLKKYSASSRSIMPSILFFLPRGLLHRDVELLPIQGEEFVKLGHRQIVIRRSYERTRYSEYSKLHWHDKWSRLQLGARATGDAKATSGLHWIDRAACADLEHLTSQLDPINVVAVGLEWPLDGTPVETSNLKFLDVILKSGAPVLVWPRHILDTSDESIKLLKELLVSVNLAHLPDALRAHEQSAQSLASNELPDGRPSQSRTPSVAFVFDNPNVLPPKEPRLVVPRIRTV